VTAPDQAAGDVTAHPPESDDAYLHCASSSLCACADSITAALDHSSTWGIASALARFAASWSQRSDVGSPRGSSC
jgi:hypothetical protein